MEVNLVNKETKKFGTRVLEIAKKYSIPTDHPILVYLTKKTDRVNEDSKARKGLANNYCFYVLAKTYQSGKKLIPSGDLLKEIRKLPFGSKLQNHSYDSRLNPEFRNTTQIQKDVLLNLPDKNNKNKPSWCLNEEVLKFNKTNIDNIINFIIDLEDEYINSLKTQDDELINQIDGIKNNKDFIELFEQSVKEESDARFFEIFSYCILKSYYSNKEINLSTSDGYVYKGNLSLYKTGRTNANDGGIDFVLKPLGKFFQVTETLNFKKYFLDFDKTLRAPFTFVIKTEINKNEVLKQIKKDALDIYDQKTTSKYMELFEEVFTNNELRDIFINLIKNKKIADQLQLDIKENFKLEYGFYD